MIGEAAKIVNLTYHRSSFNCFGAIGVEERGGRLQVINIARRHFSG
jgi:hypothetical protein